MRKYILLVAVILLSNQSLFSQVPSYVPSNGLVGYWPFSGNANDASGNGNNGTVNGATLTTDRNGNGNSAYNFIAGSNISIPMTLALHDLPNRTFSCWYYANGVQTGGRIFEMTYLKGGIGIYNGNTLDAWYNNGTYECNVTNINSGALNQWHNLVYVTNSSGLGIIYIDGILINSRNGGLQTSSNNWLNNFLRFGIGAQGESFNGNIDDIGIWNRALTPQEISNLYTSCTPPTAPTGALTQTFCASPAPTIASLTATGTGIQWYGAATGGTPLATTTALVNGTTYYASQTVSACESTTRLAVTVTLNDPQITASATTVCSGTPVTLTASTTATVAQNCNLPANLQTGLVGYWPFCGNANDVSGNANNGILLAGTSLTNDRFGNTNTAYRIDGVNTSARGIRLPININSGNDYSISLWYKIENINKSNQTIFNSSTHNFINLSYNHPYSPNNINGFVSNNTSVPCGWIIGCPGNTNNFQLTDYSNWHNVTLIKTSSNVQYYSDGILARNQVISFPLSNTTFELYLGTINLNGGFGYETFQGIMDDVAIYDRVLSPSEIAQLYTAAPTYLWVTGETTATINPTPTATTTYWCDVTVNGVTCRKTVTITVNPNITPAFTQVAPICNGATLAALPTTSTNSITGTWSPAINNTATTTYTFTPTAGQCATTATMTITVNPNITPAFTQVAPICNGATLAALPITSTNSITGTWSPAINNTSTTTYTFTPTAGQCATTVTMTITVNPNITPAFTQVAPICNGATLAALPTTSTNSITGTWSPAINNTATTTYTFTPTAGQCATTATMTITVNPIITPVFTQVAPICNGATLAALPIRSTNGITGTWSPALNNTATTTYTFTPTAGQCATTATMTITVNPNIVPTFTQVAAICAGATLAALPSISNNGITGTWSPAINNTATTIYTFTPTSGLCATTATMTITVNPLPLPPTGTITQTFCANIYPTLQNIVVTPSDIRWYSSLTSAIPLPINTALPVGSTTYFATQYNPITGCESNGRLAVVASVLLENTPSTITDQTFCINDLKTLADIKTDGLNIVWYTSATGGTPLSSNYVLTVNQTLYAAIFNASTGCESPIRQMVQITIINCQLIPNNLLTLNGNSLNDNLNIENIENFPINQIEIYNRYGEIVWKTEYYNNGSNTFLGKANVNGVYQKDSNLSTGTYYFILKYYDPYHKKYTDLKSFLYINNNN
jgi:serine protease inhibitor